MNEPLKSAVDNIVDTITCSDGGVRFVFFRNFLELMDDENSPASRAILDVVYQFSRMIDYSCKPLEGKEKKV